MTTTSTRASDYIRGNAITRRHAIEFAAANAMSFGNAYSISVDVSGHLSVQGEAGTLQHLVSLWDATLEPARGEDKYRVWAATVHHPDRPGVRVLVHVVEEAEPKGLTAAGKP